MSIEIPVFLYTIVNDVHVANARLVETCDCSPTFCCCSPEDQKQKIQITIENRGLTENILENARLGRLKGLSLGYIIDKASDKFENKCKSCGLLYCEVPDCGEDADPIQEKVNEKEYSLGKQTDVEK